MALEATTTISLLSVFTPPSSCSKSWTYENSYYNSVFGGLLIQQALPQRLDQECFPSGMRAYGRAVINQVYSPGACPAGYATPAVYKGGDVTTAICCPTGFSYSTTLTTINFAEPTSVIFAGCISGYPFGSTTTVPARAGNTALSDAVVTGPITMWAQPLTMLYQSSDLKYFGVSNSSQITSPASLPVSATVVAFPSNPSVKQNATSTISSGAIAGIVVGSLASLGILALFGCLLLHLRKSRAHTQPMRSDEQSPEVRNDKSDALWTNKEPNAMTAEQYAPVEMFAAGPVQRQSGRLHEMPA